MKFINRATLIVLSGALTMLTNGCENNPGFSEQAVRFGVVADVQYAEKPEAMGRHYVASRGALERCVTDLASKAPAFVIQLGDMIDGGPNAEQELKTIDGVYRQLPMPRYHVMGNHDFAGIDRPAVLDILGIDQSYYCFDHGSWRFVVLDTQDMAIQGGWAENSGHYQQSVAMLESLKATGAENAQEYNGGIGTEQKQWLRNLLEQADADGKKAIVFGHLPLMPVGEKHTLWNGSQIVELFESHSCVKAYFCGHQHGDGYTFENGIHYVTFEAMVDAADKDGAWAVVSATSDGLLIEGSGAVTSRQLAIDNSR